MAQSIAKSSSQQRSVPGSDGMGIQTDSEFSASIATTLNTTEGVLTIKVAIPQTEIGQELFEWWMRKAYDDASKTLPKCLEYGHGESGSADLQVMGNAQAELLGINNVPDSLKQELACWFYALGKVSRLISNYKRREPGKRDHWFDLRIYTLMAERLQEVGRWP